MRGRPLEPEFLPPAIRGKMATRGRLWRRWLTPAERTHLDTLVTLKGSLRSDAEMAEAVSVLNPILDARMRREMAGDTEGVARLDAITERVQWAANGVRSSRSGMAVDICLDHLQRAYDAARAELAALEGGA